MNCDQVFDVLTRGPFPSGDPADPAVERHLKACFECRQLAEALQPATSLFHEVLTADEGLNLPGYRGSLYDNVDEHPSLSSPNEQLPSRLAAAIATGTSVFRRQPSSPLPPPAAQNAWQLATAVLLASALCVWLLCLPLMGQGPGQNSDDSVAKLPRAMHDGRFEASDEGRQRLLSLGLPMACFPATSAGTDGAVTLPAGRSVGEAASRLLLCCTYCHSAANSQRPGAKTVAMLHADSCHACHTR